MAGRESYHRFKNEPKFFYGYVVVAACFGIIALMWGTLHSFGVFLKPLTAEFGWTRAATSGALSLSFILLGLLGMVAGKLTDRFGPKVVITVCGLFLGSGYLLLSQLNSIWQLYLFLGVFVGAGMGGSFAPLASTVARWFVKRRGLMTGIAVSGLGVGTLILSPIANWLISSYGWRTAYMVLGATVLTLIILAAQFLRRDPSQVGQVPYGENASAEINAARAPGFSFREALHTWQLWVLGVAWLCFCFSIEAVLAHIVPHAIGLGVSAASASLILAVTGGLSTVGRIVMGMAGDKIGNKLVLIICFGLLSISLFGILPAQELWMLYLFALIFGFGYGGIATLSSPIVAEQFGLSSHGVILGAVIFSGTIGEASGPVIAGYIFDATGSYNLAFLICALTGVTGLVLVSRLRPSRLGMGR